jgi:hypothetical protein
MMKVVINSCFGGFGLSHAAMLRYAEIKKIKVYAEEDKYGFFDYYTVPKEKRTPEVVDGWSSLPLSKRQQLNKQWSEERLYDREIARDDKVLVQVVEELGSKNASGRFAALKIVNILDGVEWQIDEYDGSESISEVHRTWR